MTMKLKPSTITPTVGRKMWFFAQDASQPKKGDGPPPQMLDNKVPMDATVIYVWSPSLVNLRVTDHAGNVFTRTSVPVADHDESYEHGVQQVACWMPYQSGQAAKQAAGGPPDAVMTKLHDGEVS